MAASMTASGQPSRIVYVSKLCKRGPQTEMNRPSLVHSRSKQNDASPPLPKMNGYSHAHVDAGLVILDSSLRLIAADEGAVSILGDANQDHSKPSDLSIRLPQSILEALRIRGNTELSGTKMPFRVGKQSYICRVFSVAPLNGTRGDTTLAVHFQRESSLSNAIEAVAVQYHLSDREQEALKGLASALSAKEIAEQMGISPNTVKSFVRILMIKMRVGSRAGIVKKLFESNNSTW